MAPNGNRAREGFRAHPGLARRAVVAAVAVAVGGGLFVGLRPDGDDDGAARRRKGHTAGPIAADRGAEGDQLGAPVDPAVPGTDGPVPVEGTTGTGQGPATTTPAPSTTSRGPAPGAGGSSTSSSNPSATTGGAPSTEPRVGPPSSTRPTGPGGSAAPAATAGWTALPAAPIGARTEHSAVWTGREMVIWGGTPDYDVWLNDGAAYDPAARTWRKIPAAPIAPRAMPTVVWTGQEVLVFGGSVEGEPVTDGAAWNPATNTWRVITPSPLGARDGAVIAWAGDRLVVWSGTTALGPDAPDDAEPEVRNDGAAYVPASDRWVPIGPAPIPPRSGAESAWTGTRLVITGGEGDEDDRTDGAAFDPVAGTWSAIAARPVPGSCGGGSECHGFWTGTAALFPVSGVAYDPAANRWSTLPPAPGTAPAPGEPAVWTGRWLVSWGMPDWSSDDDTGAGEEESSLPAAVRYDPAANRWEPIPAGPLTLRSDHTAVWTGEVMLIWGGSDDEAARADGAAYRPAP